MGKKVKWGAYENGTCWKIGEFPGYYYGDYLIECKEMYDDWNGLPIVNPRTMIGYEPRGYEIIMLVVSGASVLAVAFALLALLLKRLSWNLKIYLLGGLLLSLFKGMQMLYHVSCSISLKPFEGSRDSNKRFSCLDLETDGFYWNQMISSYGMAVLPVYRIMLWSLIVSRYISLRWQDLFNPLRTSYLQVAVCLFGLPWFYLLLTGFVQLYDINYYAGFYFHPLTFQVREYLPIQSILAPKAEGLNIASLAIDVLAAKLAQLTMRIIRDKTTKGDQRTIIEVRFQRMIFVTHAFLALAWLLDVLYFTLLFSRVGIRLWTMMQNDVTIYYKQAQLFTFIAENLPGWIVAIVLPLVTFGYCVQRNPSMRLKTDEA